MLQTLLETLNLPIKRINIPRYQTLLSNRILTNPRSPQNLCTSITVSRHLPLYSSDPNDEAQNHIFISFHLYSSIMLQYRVRVSFLSLPRQSTTLSKPITFQPVLISNKDQSHYQRDPHRTTSSSQRNASIS